MVLFWVLTLAVACANPSATPTPTLTPTPSPTPEPLYSRLEQALSAAPLEFAGHNVEFADYAGSCKATGLEWFRSGNDYLQLDPDEMKRLYEGVPFHGELQIYSARLYDLMGLDLWSFNLGIWTDEPGTNLPNFMVLDGLTDRENMASKLPGLDYKQAEYTGVTYYWLYEEPKTDLHHPLRSVEYFLNRIAFMDSRLLFAPTTEGIERLIDLQHTKGTCLLDSQPHKALAEAVGEGPLGGIFVPFEKTGDWTGWLYKADMKPCLIDRYLEGPDRWGVLSPYTHVLMGYSVQGDAKETVIALYYPDPDAAQKDASELEKRWDSFQLYFGPQTSCPPEHIADLEFEPIIQACGPLSTSVVTGEGHSVLLGTCPVKRSDDTESGKWGGNLWKRLLGMVGIGQIQFLIPDLEELGEAGKGE